MRGRIFEYKNMAHIGVDSVNRAYDSPAGRGRAREALARARARSAFQRCSARMAPGHVCGQCRTGSGARMGPLRPSCYVMYDVYGSGTS